MVRILRIFVGCTGRCIHPVIIHAVLIVLCPAIVLAGKGDINPAAFSSVQSGVRFIENKGQFCDPAGKPCPHLLFSASAPGVEIYITKKGLEYFFYTVEKVPTATTYSFAGMAEKKAFRSKTPKYKWERIELQLEGARIQTSEIRKVSASTHLTSYFLGHCPDGIKHVGFFDTIIIKDVYPFIDWKLYGAGPNGIKYDMIVHPGGNPDNIRLRYSSLQKPVSGDEGLSINTKFGTLLESAPYCFLQKSGTRIGSQLVAESQQQTGDHIETVFRFVIDRTKIDPAETLVIDPPLTWCTLMSSSKDDGIMSTEVDDQQNLFVLGYTSSLTYPLLDNGGFFQGTTMGNWEIFIQKFTNSGVLLWSTYYGGSNAETGMSLTVDPSGNIVITGSSMSSDFPLQNAGTFFQSTLLGGSDAFILKFDNNGNRLWCTYYGGAATFTEWGNSVVCDSQGNIFVAGMTCANDFPVFNSASYFQSAFGGGANDMFILKFGAPGNLLWATCFGGSSSEDATSITCDQSDNIFIGGQSGSSNFLIQNNGGYLQSLSGGQTDATLMKFSNSGTLLWSTFYGGVGPEQITSLGIDAQGNLFALGYTSSSNFPVASAGGYFQSALSGNGDAFVMKFNNACVRQWATFYGGPGDDDQTEYDNLAVTKCGEIFVGINTSSTTFPVKNSCEQGYFDPSSNGNGDVVIGSFSASGVLLWSTYFGGANKDFRAVLAVDSSANLFFAGEWVYMTQLNSYPLTNAGGSTYFQGTPVGMDESVIAKFTHAIPSPMTFTYGTYCTSGNTIVAPATATNFVAGGTFTGSPGLIVDPLTGVLVPSQNSPGTYTVVYLMSHCNCFSPPSSSATLQIIAAPSASVQNAQICPGQTATLSLQVSEPGLTYSWSPVSSGSASISVSPTITTSYTAVVSNTAGCSSSVVAQVSVAPEPVVTVNNATVCAGNTVTLKVNTPAVPGLSYTWMPGGMTGSFITVSPTTTVIYTVIASAGQCTAASTASVGVAEKVIVVASFSYAGPYCADAEDPLPLLAPGFLTGGSFSSNNVAVDKTTGRIDISTTGAGEFTVSYQPPQMLCALVTDSQASLAIHPTPELVIDGPKRIPPGGTASLTVSGAGSYTWSPAAYLDCIYCASPHASPPESMQFCALGAARSCTAEICKMVVVSCNDIDNLNAPNAFTPNGDGENDMFCLRGWDVCNTRFHIMIFDRWGEKVFESTNPDFCWDGHYKGKLLSADVFVYIIEADYSNGKPHQLKGNITLIR